MNSSFGFHRNEKLRVEVAIKKYQNLTPLNAYLLCACQSNYYGHLDENIRNKKFPKVPEADILKLLLP